MYLLNTGMKVSSNRRAEAIVEGGRTGRGRNSPTKDGPSGNTVFQACEVGKGPREGRREAQCQKEKGKRHIKRMWHDLIKKR